MSAEDEKAPEAPDEQTPKENKDAKAQTPKRTPKAKAPAKAEAEAKKPAEPEAEAKKPAEADEAKKPAEPEAKKPAKARKAPASSAKAADVPAEGQAAAKQPAATRSRKPKAEQEAEKSTKVSTARRRSAREPSGQVVKAHARYVRTSARKARMVCGHLRGKSVSEARAILAFTPRQVARDWSKLLESAVANAETNHELLEDDLIIQEAYADEGPTIKRFRPRAMGRATPIRKRTSHLTITLTPGR